MYLTLTTPSSCTYSDAFCYAAWAGLPCYFEASDLREVVCVDVMFILRHWVLQLQELDRKSDAKVDTRDMAGDGRSTTIVRGRSLG